LIASMHFPSALLDLNCCHHRVSALHSSLRVRVREEEEGGRMHDRKRVDRGLITSMVVWPAAIHAAVSPAPDQVLAYQFRRHDTFLLPDRAPLHERRLGVGGGREAGSRASTRPPPWRSSPLLDGLHLALRRAGGAAATPPWHHGGARAGKERRHRRARGGDGAEARVTVSNSIGINRPHCVNGSHT
jgi:hypothetical protein